jgi:hypothetical protein
LDVKEAEQEDWVPAGTFAAGFDADLRFVIALEVEGEAADDGHSPGAVALAVA